MKKFFSLGLSFTLILGTVIPTGISKTSAAFNDVSSGHPYKDAIDYVQSKNIVGGYPDGSYQPDRLINRAEFTKIIASTKFSVPEIEICTFTEGFYKQLIFNDLDPGIWFEKFVCISKKNGVIGGYPDGTFRGTQTIIFAEAAKIISVSFGLKLGQGEPWYKPFIDKLQGLNAIPASIKAIADPFAQATKEITRGEMAEMIYLLRTTSDTVTSTDGSFVLKVPESALPEGTDLSSLVVARVPSEKNPIEEVNGAPMLFYELKPKGVQFKLPVTFEIIAPTLQNTIPMVFLQTGDDFDMIPEPIIDIDQEKQIAVLSGQLTHFSGLVVAFIPLLWVTIDQIGDQEQNKKFNVSGTITTKDVPNVFRVQEMPQIPSIAIQPPFTIQAAEVRINSTVIPELPKTTPSNETIQYTAAGLFCSEVTDKALLRSIFSFVFNYKKETQEGTQVFPNTIHVRTHYSPIQCLQAAVKDIVTQKYSVAWKVVRDPGANADSIALNPPNLIITFNLAQKTMIIEGLKNTDGSTQARLEGLILKTRPLIAVGKGTAAGLPNIDFTFTYTVDEALNITNAKLIIGEEGGLRGNMPIEYEVFFEIR